MTRRVIASVRETIQLGPSRIKNLALILLFLVPFGLKAGGQVVSSMVRVGPGTLAPFYPADKKEERVAIGAFWLDPFPVTNGLFLEFVSENPRWRRDRITPLFADGRYLSHWASSGRLGTAADREKPVVHVSWFAARAFCKSRGARLPTENEWEFAASATETNPDGRGDPVWKKRVLDWYARPTPQVITDVGKTPPNFWGASDLHGLVWEWVEDFNSALVAPDARESGDAEKLRFCGSGALSASDKADYASFMRIAFLSSLKADYTTGNLGFRCAKDL